MIGCARCCAFWQGNLRFPICLCVFFSVCFDVVSFKAAKTNIAVFFFSTFCDTSEEFISFVCSVYVGAVCVFCVCVLIIAFSHQISTKRGQVGTVPINLLTIDHPEPAPPPYVKHRTLLVSTYLIKLCALHPKMLGILLWLPPFILSFLIDKKTVPIFGHSEEESILGMLPHSFQKANLGPRICLTWTHFCSQTELWPS